MENINTTSGILDLVKVNPHQKCQVLFDQFDKTGNGHSFIFGINQDPAALYQHLLSERPQPFSWERLENGPDYWQVKITKPSQENTEPTIGELATLDYRTAEVFQMLGIDYCCNGNMTLEEACRDAGISRENLDQFIEDTLNHKGKEVYAFEKWGLGFLVDYILKTHHTYIKENTPVLLELSLEVVEKQAAVNPEVKELAERLSLFLSSLSDHLELEEQFLFPAIRKLASFKKNHSHPAASALPALRDTIDRLEKEHKIAGDVLKLFKGLTNNYQLPVQSCTSCTYLFAKLLEFENDLIQHIHLENNILFPKALLLEEELRGSRRRDSSKKTANAIKI